MTDSVPETPPQTGSQTVPPPNLSPDLPPTPPAAPPPPPPDQTFVVPAAPANSNPFIPQTIPDTVQPGDAAAQSVPQAPSFGNPLLKRVMVVLIVLLVLVGAAFGVKSFLGGSVVSKPVTLNYWGLWEDDPLMETVLSTFEQAHPNVKITYTKQSPQQYRERVQAAIDRGDGPDIFRFHNTWVTMFHNELAPAPTTKDMMTAAQFAQTFYPVASADLVGGSTIYGMPVMFDGLGLFYNEDLFASAGVTVPTTWEDVLNMVPKLTVKTDTTIVTSAIALGTTGNVENWSDILATMMMQNGAKLSNPTGTQAEQAVVFYKKFATPTDPVYTWNDSMDNSVTAFANGKVAMILAPSWRAFDVKTANPNLHFKVAPIPQLPGNTVNWASYWAEGVSSKSTNQVLAWEFVQYITSKDVMAKFYTEASKNRLFGEPYARVDLGSTIASDPYVGAYVSEAPTAKSFPLASRTFDNGINDKLIKYLQDAVNAVGAGTSPTDALGTAADGFRQVFGSYGLTTGTAPSSP